MGSEPLNTRIPERHPLEPFLPKGARLLMLGSFPPKRSRWSMDFYYPNPQNDMWRIMGLVFYSDKNKFLVPGGKVFDREAIMKFCEEKGIALCDTAKEVIRLNNNASDKFLEITEPFDLEALLDKLPECHAIATTGQKATDMFVAVTGCAEPPVGSYSDFDYQGRQLRLYRMPSSSRAYPKPLGEKAGVYGSMFAMLNIN